MTLQTHDNDDFDDAPLDSHMPLHGDEADDDASGLEEIAEAEEPVFDGEGTVAQYMGELECEMLAYAEPAGASSEGPRVTVYDKLREFGLLRKLTDIVMAKVSVPWHLRKDAIQEVHAAWGTLPAKEHFERNQIANYAFLSGKHAALKLRRTIGAVVVIPGALFRSGRDTDFMASIGAAVNPHNVEDYQDSAELAIDHDDSSAMAMISERFFNERINGVQLSARQKLVARAVLVERKSLAVLAMEMGMPLMYVERLVTQATNKILARDAEAACTSARPSNRVPATSRRRTSASSSPRCLRRKRAVAE